MYAEDSFFSLTVAGRTGLVVLSAIMMLALTALAVHISRGRAIAVRVVVPLAVFWAFVWLSPQVYYTYYMFLFEDLPLQSVIKSPPGPKRIVRLLTFTERPTLAVHSAGIMGWAMIIGASLRGRKSQVG